MNIGVKVDDAAVRGALLRASKAARDDAAKATRDAVDEVLVPRARMNVPRKSGRYAASIKAVSRGRAGIVQARAPYATVLEEGRAPMRITVRTKKALTTPGGPRRSVQSPRYPRRRVLREAVLPGVPQAARLIERYVASALRHHLGQ